MDVVLGRAKITAAKSGAVAVGIAEGELYAAGLRSDTADIANSGAREGGASLAATFLERFARGFRWAHLDIASTAWSPVERPHEPRGPTGFGVRLLLEWLSRRAWG